MGQYHYLVNLVKKQVVHPHQIGNGLKLYEQIRWDYSTATVLVMLLSASSRDGGRGGGDFRASHPLVGSWAGDRIAFVGDYAEPDDIPGVDAELLYAQSNAACSPDETGDKPEGWQEWTNISPQIREMMSAEFGVRYQGDGWMNVVEKDGAGAVPSLAPDLVITSSAMPKPPVKSRCKNNQRGLVETGSRAKHR